MYNANTVKPLDYEAIDAAIKSKRILILDEHVSIGGFGESIASYILHSGKGADIEYFNICSIQDEFPDKVYNMGDLLTRYGLIEESVLRKVIEMTQKS